MGLLNVKRGKEGRREEGGRERGKRDRKGGESETDRSRRIEHT